MTTDTLRQKPAYARMHVHTRIHEHAHGPTSAHPHMGTCVLSLYPPVLMPRYSQVWPRAGLTDIRRRTLVIRKYRSNIPVNKLNSDPTKMKTQKQRSACETCRKPSGPPLGPRRWAPGGGPLEPTAAARPSPCRYTAHPDLPVANPEQTSPSGQALGWAWGSASRGLPPLHPPQARSSRF